MKKIWKPTLFFIFCLLVSLVINLPVAVILGEINVPANIKLSGVTGRLSEGQVSQIYVNQFPIQDVNYHADLSCLLTLNICYQINYLNGTGRISFNPLTNQATIQKLDVDYSMAELSPLMSQLLVKPTGDLSLKANLIGIKQNKINNIDGFAIWSNAGVAGENINLGAYQLGIVREDESYRIELTDRDAILDIDGKGRLKSNGQYTVEINIKAKSGLDASIKSLLELSTRKRGLNEYSFNRQGQLPPQVISQLAFSDSN